MAETTDKRLQLLIERVESIDSEIDGLKDDKRDVFAEMKAVGYDVPIARMILRLRKLDPDKRNEQDMILDTYRTALGIA